MRPREKVIGLVGLAIAKSRLRVAGVVALAAEGPAIVG